MKRILRQIRLVTVGMTASIFLDAPQHAQACGGFFCSQNAPVNQAAERIIFIDHEDDTVTAIVQVLYQGPSERFSWVIPVPGVPTVGVSSNTAFQRLQAATNPTYTLNTEVEGDCAPDIVAARGSAENFPSASNDAGVDSEQDAGVTVVGGGSVGPYDYEVISLDPVLADPGDVAVTWLEENGYDLGPADNRKLFGPYLEKGMNLIAFRLTKAKNVDSGEIRPITMRYSAKRPMIPIKLTGVAANDNMGVLVWNFAAHRSVVLKPYHTLQLNGALINWFNAASNYNDVINRAADEAKGQGFVTEMASQTKESVADVIFAEDEKREWEALKNKSWSDNPKGLVEATAPYIRWDGYQDIVRDFIALPETVSPADFVANFRNFIAGRAAGVAPDVDLFAKIDSAKFLAAFYDTVIKPMEETQALVDSRPFMTRHYTTMSATEMTVDPEFDFDAKAGPYSNQHQATRIVECDSSITQAEAPWRVLIPQDGKASVLVRGIGAGNWPIETTEAPANIAIFAMSVREDGEIERTPVTDNEKIVTVGIADKNRAVEDERSTSGGSCALGRAQASGIPSLSWLALLGGLLIFRRKRRRS